MESLTQIPMDLTKLRYLERHDVWTVSHGTIGRSSIGVYRVVRFRSDAISWTVDEVDARSTIEAEEQDVLL